MGRPHTHDKVEPYFMTLRLSGEVGNNTKIDRRVK